MKTKEQKEVARFEEWKATKHFTYVNDVENDELFTSRTGIDSVESNNLWDLTKWLVDESLIIGYFTYEDGAIIVATDQVKFYDKPRDFWATYENAEERLWKEKSSKTWKVETPLKDILVRLAKAGITPDEISYLVFADMYEMTYQMTENNMDFNDFLKMMEANNIDGNDIEHLIEKFDNHIEMINSKPDLLDLARKANK